MTTERIRMLWRMMMNSRGTELVIWSAVSPRERMPQRIAAKTIAIVYGNDGRSAGARYGGSADRYDTAAEQMWFPFGMTSPGAVSALMFQRHAKRYGTTTRQLGAISVAVRKHASMNPAAKYRDPITVEEIMAVCAEFEAEYHEEIADALFQRFGGVQILKAHHHGVDVETRRGE